MYVIEAGAVVSATPHRYKLFICCIAGYNVFSVVLVFSMLSLGRILVSDLVVART